MGKGMSSAREELLVGRGTGGVKFFVECGADIFC